MALPEAHRLHLTPHLIVYSTYLPGVFNMWVVIADYLLVITWFACTTVCLERLIAKASPLGKNRDLAPNPNLNPNPNPNPDPNPDPNPNPGQVCTLDGHVYERAAIEGWLAHKVNRTLTLIRILTLPLPLPLPLTPTRTPRH